MSEGLSGLQRSVLDKYRVLARVLKDLDQTLSEIGGESETKTSPERVLQQLREIEMKLALVGTLLKGSVYSLVREGGLS